MRLFTFGLTRTLYLPLFEVSGLTCTLLLLVVGNREYLADESTTGLGRLFTMGNTDYAAFHKEMMV